MTDASYEVSDDFMPEVAADSLTLALVSLFDEQKLLTSAADSANGTNNEG